MDSTVQHFKEDGNASGDWQCFLTKTGIKLEQKDGAPQAKEVALPSRPKLRTKYLPLHLAILWTFFPGEAPIGSTT